MTPEMIRTRRGPMKVENLFAALPADRSREAVETLLEQPGFLLERIVSRGHASPEGGGAKITSQSDQLQSTG